MRIIKWVVGGLFVLVSALVAVAVIFVATLDVEQYRERIENEAFKATGRKLTLAGPIDLKISLSPVLVIEDATLANASWGSREEMVFFERLEFSADLLPLINGKVRIAKLVLIGADILIETDASGGGNWVFEVPDAAAEPSTPVPETGPIPVPGREPAPQSQSQDLAFGIDKLEIRDSVFTYRDGATGKETKIVLTRLTGSAPDRNSPIELDIAAEVDGKAFALAGTIGAIDQIGTEPFPIDLNISAGGAKAAVRGEIADLMEGQGLVLDVSIEGDELGALNDLAGGGIPALGVYSVTLHVEQTSPTKYQIAGLALRLGNSDLSGSATVEIGGARPSVTADLTSDRLDLARLSGAGASDGGAVAVRSGANGGSGGGQDRFVLSEDPLPFDALGMVDAEVKLKVGALDLDGTLTAQNVDLTLVLEKGKLAISPASFDLSSGGHVTVVANIDAAVQRPPVTLKIDADGLDYGRLLSLYGDENSFAGTVNIDADLSGAGTSLHAIGSTLNGPLEIRGENGTIDNRWLKVLTGGFGDILGPLFGNQQSAALHCVQLTILAQGGRILVKGIALDSEVFTLYGGGTIDLRTESLDLSFNSGTRQLAISSLVPPFNVTGTLKDPKVRPNVAGAITGLVGVLGGAINPQNILDVFTNRSASTGGGGANSCSQALQEAGRAPAPTASPVDQVTETVGSALDKIKEGLQGSPEKLEDAAKEALEGLKGLFGR